MKLGCHCVLFREKIATDTHAVLSGMASTGFQGVEMGARFFGTERKEFLQQALQEAGIQLAALHVGVPMDTWITDPDKAIAIVTDAANFIKDFPNKNLTMSGNACSDPEAAARAMDRAALACRELGVTLGYHNHASEFLVDDAATYKAIRDFAPHMNFAFDLGWVQKGGYDPYQVLEENRGRVSYVHLRDFAGQKYLPEGEELKDDYTRHLGGDITPFFPDLGGGQTDFRKMLAFLSDYLPADGWAVVEYETGEQDFGRYAKARAFLDSQV